MTPLGLYRDKNPQILEFKVIFKLIHVKAVLETRTEAPEDLRELRRVRACSY